jgi:DNA-binding CsgD family transcriptional regulator
VTTPATASERDLRALAGIVSDHRTDIPAEGVPPSLLADLVGQIRCDGLSLERFDGGRQVSWLVQAVPAADAVAFEAFEALEPPHWQHYWNCPPCSYPDRTGDLRSIVTIADFYSARQWHATGMYSDLYRPQGYEHALLLSLPAAPGPARGSGQILRLGLFRGPGPGFSERDRALLVLLRPHLHQAYLDTERHRHPVPRLTARQKELLRLVAAGHTNTQIGRRLGISEGTVRTHLENIYARLQVPSRTAAVMRAFPDRAVQ